jgi:hypothetical protein
MSGAASADRTAVLVVRTWWHGAPPRLAGRITYTLDVERAETVVLAVADDGEIAAAVRRWLDELAASKPPVTGP